MAESRLIGGYPVIGIRPTIDGRRGALDVRGSLEEQTMNMAKSAAKLFEENLKYSNGEPVKVVIADTTIGRVAESAACAEKFKKGRGGYYPFRNPLLVLRVRDHGYGPHDDQRRVGPERHRAPRGRLSGLCAGRIREKGTAGFWNLWEGCTGCG